MRYFENALLMRRAYLPKEGENAYRIHCYLEEMIIEQAKVNSPYSYSYKSNMINNQAIILTRSATSLGFPGERENNFAIQNGDSVSFVVALHTSKTSDITNKDIGVTDEKGQIIKLERVSAKNGFDVVSAQRVSDASMKMKKGRNSFSLTGGLLIVQAKICDKSLFELAFINGIGRKRNFGFGQLCALEVVNA